MPAIIVLVLIAVLALVVLGAVVHVLFSPWLLLPVIAILLVARLASRRRRR